MDFLRFLKSKTFFKNLTAMTVLTFILIFIAIKMLSWFTKHGQSITLPDFTGLYPDEIFESKQYRNFDFIIIDSVYDETKEKGSIAAQDPLPESKVKNGRKIYLTILSILPEQVTMPDLTDLTLRQATAILETYGLKIASLKFIPDIGATVIEQRYRGNKIESGEKITKGSKIELLVGSGLSDEKVAVPLLIGKKRQEAITILHSAGLNVGSENYMDGNDTLKIRVFKQSPRPSTVPYKNMGESVDIWYRSETKFNFKEYLKSYERDSIFNPETEEEN